MFIGSSATTLLLVLGSVATFNTSTYDTGVSHFGSPSFQYETTYRSVGEVLCGSIYAEYGYLSSDGFIELTLENDGSTYSYLRFSDCDVDYVNNTITFYLDITSTETFNFTLQVDVTAYDEHGSTYNYPNYQFINYAMEHDRSNWSWTLPFDLNDYYSPDELYFDFNLTYFVYDLDTYRLLSQPQRSYQEGYDDGYVDGVIVGGHGAYEEAYSDGYFDGENAGYLEGLEDGRQEDETISTIASAIFQVATIPVNFFLAIFNYEIFGINLSSFISALLTIAVIVILFKTIFGGKSSND